jgi:Lon protease-like protein
MPALATLERLPVLPLPGIVLVPGMVLPLNVIEPAERELVDFIRERDPHLGVPLLRPQEREPDGRPAFEAVFGLGRMMLHTRLDDGRRVIRLEGVARVRLVREHPLRRGFREVTAAPLYDPRQPDADALAVLRAQLERIAARHGAYELALTTALAIAEPTAFLDAVTICLPCLELLGCEGRAGIAGFTARTTGLQQQSLAAESADQRVALLSERASAALARLKGRGPPRLSN